MWKHFYLIEVKSETESVSNEAELAANVLLSSEKRTPLPSPCF